MKTIEIKEDAVLKAHNEASKKGKTLLENLFSGSVFKKDIKDRVKTIEDAIDLLGNTDEDVVDYKAMLSSSMQKHIIGNQELIIITKALNEGWKPDWSNGQWDKWFNWFDFDSSSSSGRFSFHGSVVLLTHSHCGSRLCFKSKALAEYAANQFFEIYKKTYTI